MTQLPIHANVNLNKLPISLDKAIPLKGLSNVLNFKSFLGEAMAFAQGAVQSAPIELERKKSTKALTNVDDVKGLYSDGIVLAQAGVQGAAANADLETINRVPLQLFLDKTIESLNNLSDQEFRVNDLIKGFVDGTVSEDEVIIETAKLNLSVQMVTSIVQAAVTSFKEILQIAV